MTNILTMRTFFSVALLAIFTVATACSDDDIVHTAAEKAEQLGAQAEDAIVQRARALADDTREGAAAQAEANQRVAAIGHRMGHALDEEARELTDAIRSGRDALAAETALVAEAVKKEANELAGGREREGFLRQRVTLEPRERHSMHTAGSKAWRTNSRRTSNIRPKPTMNHITRLERAGKT